MVVSCLYQSCDRLADTNPGWMDQHLLISVVNVFLQHYMTVQNLYDEELKQFPCNKATNNKKKRTSVLTCLLPSKCFHPKKNQKQPKQLYLRFLLCRAWQAVWVKTMPCSSLNSKISRQSTTTAASGTTQWVKSPGSSFPSVWEDQCSAIHSCFYSFYLLDFLLEILSTVLKDT